MDTLYQIGQWLTLQYSKAIDVFLSPLYISQ
jgi:hypothetical protein